MNIQIFGKSKCFDTKKAERYFKERRVKYQYIDMKKYGISRGELNGVLRSVPLSDLVDPKHPDAALLQYLAYDQDKVEKVLENPTLLRTPIVRNGKQATVGYQPEQWNTWRRGWTKWKCQRFFCEEGIFKRCGFCPMRASRFRSRRWIKYA